MEIKIHAFLFALAASSVVQASDQPHAFQFTINAENVFVVNGDQTPMNPKFIEGALNNIPRHTIPVNSLEAPSFFAQSKSMAEYGYPQDYNSPPQYTYGYPQGYNSPPQYTYGYPQGYNSPPQYTYEYPQGYNSPLQYTYGYPQEQNSLGNQGAMNSIVVEESLNNYANLF